MIRAAIFDVFGTVVDWRGGIAQGLAPVLAAKGIAVDPVAIAEAWRAEYDPSMQPIRSGARSYVPLDVLHRENLDRVLSAFGLEAHFGLEERDDMTRLWERLPPWPDATGSLRNLARSHLIAPCSNGSIAMMARLARHAGLPWHCVLGADIARDFKPAPEVYLASARALRLQPSDVVMVSTHAHDLAAAQANGLATAFIPRPRQGDGQGRAEAGKWTYTARDLADLTDQLAA
ncbi:MAG: haloacid dehalogenase type II [Pseudomonadota bacterium]